MQEFLFGLVALALGLAFVFSGWRLFRILIPIWGFFGGFTLGAAVSVALFGGNFLGNSVGLVAGLALGLLFALLSYLFFNIAVLVLAATVGYWLGVGFMTIFGFSANGVLAVTAGIIVALLVGVLALAGNFAKYFVIFVSAFGGATTTISGILLIIQRVDINNFSVEATRGVIANSWLWGLVWLILGAVGVASQIQSSRRFEQEQWSYIASSTSVEK